MKIIRVIFNDWSVGTFDGDRAVFKIHDSGALEIVELKRNRTVQAFGRGEWRRAYYADDAQ